MTSSKRRTLANQRFMNHKNHANFGHKILEITGFLRTFIISYGIPGKQARLRKIYEPFISEGMLCFDIGSHFGNRIPVWSKLGANIVAIEPQPRLFKFLTRRYAKWENVTLLQTAVSDQKGILTLFHNTRNPSLSSIDKSWVDDKKKDPMWGNYVWDDEIQVQACTLDQLIAKYGIPGFCKIDVEGAEHKVLAGLSVPLKCVSFEYLTIDMARSLSCIDRLEQLGLYEYNWTFSEKSELKSPVWLSASEMKVAIEHMNDGVYSGDVYARLRTL